MKTTEFKQIRQGIGWNMQRLAEFLDVKLTTVWRMENGKTKIRRPVKIVMRQLRDNYDKFMESVDD